MFESVSSNLLWAPAPRTPSTRAPSTSRLLAAPCSYFWATGTGKHVQRAPHRTQPKGARGTGVCPRPRAQPRPAPLTSIMRATMPSPLELTALGITICLQCMGRVTESHLLLTCANVPSLENGMPANECAVLWRWGVAPPRFCSGTCPLAPKSGARCPTPPAARTPCAPGRRLAPRPRSPGT